jgi:hypothetical protein
LVISDAEKLARAVLMFYRGGPWTVWDSEVWFELTGSTESSTRTLSDFARKVLRQEEDKSAER